MVQAPYRPCTGAVPALYRRRAGLVQAPYRHAVYQSRCMFATYWPTCNKVINTEINYEWRGTGAVQACTGIIGVVPAWYMRHSGSIDTPYTNPVISLPHIDQRVINTEINYERRGTGAVQAPYRRRTGLVQAPYRRHTGAVQAPYRRRTGAVQAPYRRRYSLVCPLFFSEIAQL